MHDGSTSRRTLISGSLKSTMTSTTSISLHNSSSNPMMIANRYCVGRKIGFGNFGEVRFGKNVNTGECVAIKLESIKARIPQLKGEHQLYLLLGGKSEGIPNVYYYGPFASHNALVLEFLGPNLEQLFMKYSRKFLYKTVLLIAMQLLKRFEYVHSKGIIFRDVKPENFVIGNGINDSTIYIIDFGLAKTYINLETKQHIPYCSNKNLSGTARYMSVNTHLGCEQSRRDDLESLGYMLIYFLRGALPWQGLKAENIFERYNKIGLVKKATAVDTLCYNLSDEWSEYMSYVKQLEFDQNPDYNFLYNIFCNACKKNGFIIDRQFEWSDQECSLSITPNRLSSPQYKVIIDPITTLNQHEDPIPLQHHGGSKTTTKYKHMTTNQLLHNMNNYSEVFNANRCSMPLTNRNGHNDTTISSHGVTSTVLNDTKKNQQKRVERFKSHSRKPTPSHFFNGNKKKSSGNDAANSNAVAYQNTLSLERNASSCDGGGGVGRFNSFKVSIWNCCYKFRRSTRINDGFE